MATNNKNTQPKNDKTWFDRLFASKRFTLIISLAAAVVLWMVVVTLQPNSEDFITGVPVDLETNSLAYTSQNLDIIDRPQTAVTVKVRGDGSTLAGLSASDIIVYPDYSTVTGPGTYTLNLEVRKSAGGLSSRNWEIDSITSEGTIELTFSQMSTKQLPINVNVSGAQPADGYYVDAQPVVVPDQVTVRGPEDEVSRVVRVEAAVTLEDELDRTQLIPNVPLVYLDENGEQVPADNLSADVSEVEVTVNVLKLAEVPLQLEFTGVPAGYDTSQLNATLSQSTIRVAGPTDQVDALEYITAGYVDLSQFALGEPVTVDVMVPDGLRNVDDVQQVEVTFDTYGFTTRTVSIGADQIRAVNVPADTTVNITTTRLNNVTLVGLASELDALTEADIIAQVDASPENISVLKGQQSLLARIIVNNATSVFATGSYEVLCDIDTTGTAAGSLSGEAG